jgi:cytoskeletal protein CcmA (bactofilin family)
MALDSLKTAFVKRREAPDSVPRASAFTDPSVIEPDTTVYGDLRSLGTIEIHGTVQGNIFGDKLVVGPKGHVEGALFGFTVRVEGTVVGRIESNEVTIASTARINGNVCHSELVIEDGALIEGLRPWRPARTFEEIIAAGAA